MALALATLAEAGNYETRMIDLIDSSDPPSARMVVEIYYADRWHLYDPITGSTYSNSQGGIASYKDLRLDPNLIASQSIPQGAFPMFHYARESMLAVLESGLHHYYRFRREL
jgi:hypothetical protein